MRASSISQKRVAGLPGKSTGVGKYVADVLDPNAFDTVFHEAFSNRLAFVTCKEVTGATAHQDRLREDFKEVMAEAKQIGAIADRPAQEFPEDEWLSVRR